MDVFEYQLTVTKDDIDELKHVNNMRYLHWVNEAAKKHWFKISSKEINKNFFWVVASHNIEYKSSAFLNDIVTIKTYVTKSENVISSRVVEMYNSKTNKLIAKAVTNWCLINSETNRPARIPEKIINLFN